MKDFDALPAQLRDSERIELEIAKEARKELKLVGSQRKIKGHTLYEYNTETGEITLPEYKKVDLYINPRYADPSKIKIRSKVIAKKDCIYRQALNIKNVKKVLRREGYMKGLKG